MTSIYFDEPRLWPQHERFETFAWHATFVLFVAAMAVAAMVPGCH